MRNVACRERNAAQCTLSAGEQTVLVVRFYTKIIILSRQARDKHRENSKKSTVFLQWIELFPFWPKKEPASFGGEEKHAKPSVSQTPSHKEFQEFQWKNPNSMLYQDRLGTNVSKSLREHLLKKRMAFRAHTGLMAKGGFRLWANYTPSSGVGSSVRLKSLAGASAVLLNPWPGHNASVVVVQAPAAAGASSGGSDGAGDSGQYDEHEIMRATTFNLSESGSSRNVPTTWVQTAAGPALKFDTAAGEDKTYIISKVEGSKQAPAAAAPSGDAGQYTSVGDPRATPGEVACPNLR